MLLRFNFMNFLKMMHFNCNRIIKQLQQIIKLRNNNSVLTLIKLRLSEIILASVSIKLTN